MNVLDYIEYETLRQFGSVREALGMYQAHHYLVGYVGHEGDRLSDGAFLFAHKLIKGEEYGGGRFRNTPVTFRDGGHAVNHENIERLWLNLFQTINDQSEAGRRNFADYFVKEFLDIHPFSDGNGRVGSLLWNVLRGTLDDPEPMPYFYGEA